MDVTDARSVMQGASAVAKARGYEDEECPECLNFTLVRDGVYIKCDTCGQENGKGFAAESGRRPICNTCGDRTWVRIKRRQKTAAEYAPCRDCRPNEHRRFSEAGELFQVVWFKGPPS